MTDTSRPSGGTTGLKNLTRVLTANNRQFLSVAPSTILIHELGWHHSTIGIPDERNPHFPTSTVAQRSGPGS